MCWETGAGRVTSVCYLHLLLWTGTSKNLVSVHREEGICRLFLSFFDNCSVLSYRLLQAPCANRKDDADQSDVELSESLSELYQRKFSETSAAAGSGNNKKRRMYTLGLYVHVVKKR